MEQRQDKKDAVQVKNDTHFVYVIDGDPVPLARVRFGGGRAWNSQKALKTVWQREIAEQHNGRRFYYGPLHLDVCFFMNIPQSKSMRVRNELLEQWHHIKPDTSNLLKWIEDCGTKILYDDDAQISIVTACKKYDEHPRVEFKVIELKGK